MEPPGAAEGGTHHRARGSQEGHQRPTGTRHEHRCTPLNGRNFEYFGEDPYLAGRTGVAFIKGIQDDPVVANAEHFAANNQETDRNTTDARIDERTMREIYLPAFEASVKEGHVGSLMCAYNRVNGSHACENKRLLTKQLRDDWGFDGFVVSDWVPSTRPPLLPTQDWTWK